MVDVNVGYHTHGHHRSLSSLASSIMPITSDTSATTSLTASPVDLTDSNDHHTKIISTPHVARDEHTPRNSHDGRETRHDQPIASSTVDEDRRRTDGPLEQDTVQEDLSAEVVSKSRSVPWHDLVEQAQEAVFEKRRCARLEKEVATLKFANGLNRRLQATSNIAYGNLIDQFKGDDQAGFTGLFEASERLSARCESSRRSIVEQASITASEPPEEQRESFHITREDAESIMSFLNRLRTDLDYLSDLITNLPYSDLSSLTSCYHPAGVDLSILPNHSHGRTSAYSRDSQMMKLSRRMDNIDLFHNRDPYFTLLHTIFDSSAGAGSQEARLRREVWARTCARVVTDGKDGSEEFIIATIDAFMSTDSWDLNADIELYVLNVLAEGWFVLDPPLDDSPEATGSNWEPERADHAIAVAEFFDRHTEKLLLMLAAKHRTSMPVDCLNFIRLMLSHIKEPQTRELAKKFVVSRWYFASFITSLLVYPEVRGLCLDHHIGHSARQKILHRLALHIQSQVFSVLAPNSALTYILPEVREQVVAITEQFDPTGMHSIVEVTSSKFDSIQHHLMMSPWDIIGLVESLHPERLEEDSTSQSRPGTSSSTLDPQNPMEAAPIYAASLSTDSTYVDDGILTPFAGDVKDSQTQDDSKIIMTPNVQRMPRLVRAISKLRSSALGLVRDRPDYTRRDWLHFQTDPKEFCLQLDQAMSQSFDLQSESPLKASSENLGNRDPEYHSSWEALMNLLLAGGQGHITPNAQKTLALESSDSFAPLLESCISSAKANHRFQDAQNWWRRLAEYKSLEETNGAREVYSILSQEISQSIGDRTMRLQTTVKDLDVSFAYLDDQRRRYDHTLTELSARRKALRIKMWYASDVKNSAPYEDALRVARALRAMAQPKKQKQTSGFASWARQRLRGATPYDKADRQALEAMSAPKDEGGLSKLADDQIEMTSRWTTKSSIEIFCQGEERIHRFFFEVQKLVQKLAGTNLLESPVLWSSHFFRQEKRSFDSQIPPVAPPQFASSPITPPLGSQAFSQAWSSPPKHRTAAIDRGRGSSDLNGLHLTSSQYNAYATISHNRYDTHRSILPSQAHGYLSPPMTPLSPRPVEVFGANAPTKITKVPKAKQDFVDGLRRRLLGLVNSDLGYLLWAAGSETDAWIKKVSSQLEGVSQGAASPQKQTKMDEEQHQGPHFTRVNLVPEMDPSGHFNFNASYGTILSTMSLSQDPRKKLDVLSNLQDLVLSSCDDSQVFDPTKSSSEQTHSSASLAKITDQCTKRYTSSVRQRSRSKQSNQITFPPFQLIDELQNIFSNPSLRPSTLFRDLQAISSLVPSSTLDHTGEGSAFWTASIAALSVKDTLIAKAISRAQAITEYHLSIRATHPPLLPPDTQEDKADLSNTTLKDAADLWLIGAKEGHPIAARELALFYLTHPELVKRTTRPMTKAKDVFGATSPSGAGGAALDPKTFCVVLHWMEVAAAGGDHQAIDFLRENSGKKA